MSNVRKPRMPRPKIPKIKKPSISKPKHIKRNQMPFSIKKSTTIVQTKPNSKKKHVRVKRAKSKDSKYMKSQLPEIKKDILKCRLKQSKLVGQIKEDIKKIRENNISIAGLEQISLKSINSIHEKRKKSFLHLKSTIDDLDNTLKEITNLEKKYKQNL